MSFSYDQTLAADRDRVRFNLADTASSAYAFEDEELTALLTAEGSVNDATAAALRALLADKSRRAKKFSDQGLSLDDTAQVAAITALLELYGGDEPTVTVTMPAFLPMDAGYDEIVVS